MNPIGKRERAGHHSVKSVFLRLNTKHKNKNKK
jgi:hypothetical protein